MSSPATRSLYLRMGLSLSLLALVTIGFVVAIWVVFVGILSVFTPPGTAYETAAVVTAALLVTVGVVERDRLLHVEQQADAVIVDRDDRPELYAVVTKVAAHLDVPVPTIAISDSTAPEAMAVGFRPGNVHLVLSRGTLEALSGPELEAVIAHELAHVKNRDAMVMTVLSTPVVLADGLRARLSEPEDPGALAFVIVPLLFVATVVWVVGRTITAVCSRTREVAADRAAVEATGSPTALASALRTLDERIGETPRRDLREVAAVSSLSILPLAPADVETVMLGPEGDVEPTGTTLARVERFLFRTHPRTADRLESLAALEQAQ